MNSPMRPGAASFKDARDCKNWLKALPLTHAGTAQPQMRDALHALNAQTGFDPLERLTCLELFRDKVAFVLDQQRTKLAAKTMPLLAGEYLVWQSSLDLAREMERGYEACWQQTGAGQALQPHAALILQRWLRYLGAQAINTTLVFRAVEAALWTRLHRVWREAEQSGLADKRVKDSLGTADGYSSPQQAYVEVLLAHLANRYAETPRQADFADSVLARFSQKVVVVKTPPTIGPCCVVDLEGEHGAELHTRFAPHENLRVLDCQEFSRSLRRRLKKLEEGEEPGKLDLPADWSGPEAQTQLLRLHRRWCEGAEAASGATEPEVPDVAVLFGIAEIDYFLRGDMFEQPGAKRELTREEMRDIQLFGRITESTSKGRAVQFQFSSENWKIVDSTPTLTRLMRPVDSTRGVALGKLMGLRVRGEKSWRLAVVREMLDEPVGYIIVTVEMLPGGPQNAAVRSADAKTRAGPQYFPGLMLPADPAQNLPEALVVPANLVKKGGEIDINAGGNARKRTVITFVERGSDFDCLIAN